MTDYTPLTACLACGTTTLKPYCNLGEQPLANAFQDDTKWEKYPLGLQFCTTCFHSQNLVAVDPDLLYRNYAYASGTSQTLRTYFEDFVVKVEKDIPLPALMPGCPFIQARRHLRVLDIASNDGSLLREFQQRGHTVLGVDPAQNLFDDSIPTCVNYWDKATADTITQDEITFDVIIAMNVLGHVADPLTFLQLCKQVLAPGGRIYVQTSQAQMVLNAEFDTVYHEHLSFFTAKSFCILAARAGLHIANIRHVAVHGTSYLVELVDQTVGAMSDDVVALTAQEKSLGFYDDRTYLTFNSRITTQLQHVASTVALFRREGYAVIGYGAAAKGIVFLNASHLHLDALVDDAPLKIGKYAPGTELKVQFPGILAGGKHSILFVILAWTMRDEIIDRIKARRPGAKDKFLTYFPAVTVI